MKIFHKKFLNQEENLEGNQREAVQNKSKPVYLLNQVLIWSIILIVVFFIFKFILVNFN
jgi:hypothetical protein